jgi:hypothetical protein
MTFNFCGLWRMWGVPLIVSAVGLGCGSNPPAEKGPATPSAVPAPSPAVEANTGEATAIDSPAFVSPEEAVQAWLKAYQQDGEEGHRRLTFDQNDLPDEQWQKTLTEGYDAAAKAGDVQVLETLTRDELAAVVVRLGDRVDRFVLYRDAKGWHLCRTLRSWDAVKMPSEYRGVVKAAFNLGADASVKEIEWRKKLASD